MEKKTSEMRAGKNLKNKKQNSSEMKANLEDHMSQ